MTGGGRSGLGEEDWAKEEIICGGCDKIRAPSNHCQASKRVLESKQLNGKIIIGEKKNERIHIRQPPVFEKGCGGTRTGDISLFRPTAVSLLTLITSKCKDIQFVVQNTGYYIKFNVGATF